VRAFRWHTSSGLVLLDTTYPPSSGSFARATNRDGSIVVGDYFVFGQPGTRAFLWDQNRGFVDLRDVLIANAGLGSQLAGWQLLTATDVSLDGRTIVGQGINPSGCEQAFLVRFVETGTPFCFDDGSGAACPCANASAVGANAGCLNSLGTGGKLRASGVASIGFDSLVLEGSQMPNSSVIFLQCTAQQSGGQGAPFGDGLRCLDGTLIRLSTKLNAAGASQFPAAGDPLVSVRGLITTAATREYQCWYRNAASFCTPSTFNMTNGVSIVWTF